MPLTANAAFTERHMVESIAIPMPAAGAPIIYAVPDNQVIQVVGLYFALATSGVVADRRVVVHAYQDVGTGVVQGSVASVVQTATTTYDYDFSCGIAPVDASGDAPSLVVVPLACGLQLQAGEELHIYALRMDVADQFAAITMRSYRWKED